MELSFSFSQIALTFFAWVHSAVEIGQILALLAGIVQLFCLSSLNIEPSFELLHADQHFRSLQISSAGIGQFLILLAGISQLFCLSSLHLESSFELLQANEHF